MAHKVMLLGQIEAKTVPLLNLNGEAVGEVVLPPIFNYPLRKDLIRRAFHAAHTASLQPKGRDPLAGKRRVGESWGLGHSVARVPRLDNGRAVFAPMVRGGRLAHPPKVEKVIKELINKKERVRALISAIAATADITLVKARGHLFTASQLPIVVVDDLVNVGKASEAKEVLKKLGVWDDVVRAAERTRIRAGKGKMRGRKYVTPKSVLIVTHEDLPNTYKAFRNLPGVDVVPVRLLSVIHLAPGGWPGRLTIYTKSAVEALKEMFEVVRG